MSADDRHTQIGEAVEECGAYWLSQEVPRERVEEMKSELGQHLREAAGDGKSVEDVIGADLEAFAETWAAPNRRVKPLWKETVDLLSDALVGLAVLATLAHLVLWSPALPVGWRSLAYVVSFALALARLFAYLRDPSGSAPGSEESVWDRYPKRLAWAVVILLLASTFAWVYLPLPDETLFAWPWPATVASLAVAALLRGLKSTAAQAEGGRPGRQGGSVSGGDEREEITDVLLDCRLQWMMDRVPEDEIEAMGAELDRHLREATADGKPIEAVVGPDVKDFAKSWAEESGGGEERTPEPLRHRIEGWVFSVSAFLAFAATLAHVFGWSLYVPVAWFPLLLLIFLGSWILGKAIELTKRPGDRPWWKAWSVVAGAALLLAGLAVGLAAFAFWVREVVPFEWPWYATAISAMIAFVTLFRWVRG